MDGFLAVSVVTAILSFFSPGIAMLVVRSTVRYSPYSYAFGLTSCILWIELWHHHHLDALMRLSMFGTLAYATYLAFFLWKSEAADARRICLLRYVLGGGMAVLLAGLALRIFAGHAAYNNFCSTVACFTSLAPLWKLPVVYRTKSMEAMPSVIVAGLTLLNAMIWTWRNTVKAESINLNLAIPSGVAMFSALVQVVLYLVCRCLPRPLLPPADAGIDQRPLLVNQDQTEAGGGGNGLHGGGNSGNANGRETRLNIQEFEEVKNETNDTMNLLLPQDNLQHGQEELRQSMNETLGLKFFALPQDKHQHGRHEELRQSKNETLDLKNHGLPQDIDHGRQEDLLHSKNETVDLTNLGLPQDIQHGEGGIRQVKDQTIGLKIRNAKNEAIHRKNLGLPQDGQHDAEEKKGDVNVIDQLVVVRQEDKDIIAIAKVKPAKVVESEEGSSSSKVDQVDTAARSTSKVDQPVDTAVPQQGKKA